MREHPEVVLLGTQVRYVCEGRELRVSAFPTGANEIRRRLEAHEGIHSHPGIVFRKILNDRDELICAEDQPALERL